MLPPRGAPGHRGYETDAVDTSCAPSSLASTPSPAASLYQLVHDRSHVMRPGHVLSDAHTSQRRARPLSAPDDGLRCGAALEQCRGEQVGQHAESTRAVLTVIPRGFAAPIHWVASSGWVSYQVCGYRLGRRRGCACCAAGNLRVDDVNDTASCTQADVPSSLLARRCMGASRETSRRACTYRVIPPSNA